MNRLDAYQLFQDGTLSLAEVERRGIHIDVAYCDEKLEWIYGEDGKGGKFNQAQRRFQHSPLGQAWQARFDGKVNYQSGDQLRAVLGADFHIKPVKETDGGEASADEESLRRSGVEGTEQILRMRRLKKMGDVLTGLRRSAVNGIAHPSFMLHTVATYRSSSSGPNLQNVPVRDAEMQEICRRAIRPSPGYRLVEVDFKGAEVAVAACVTGDTKISTLSGELTIRQIIRFLRQGESIHTFGYDLKKGRISIANVTAAGKTGSGVEVWKVTLDNGETIRATPDHQFLLRNGEYTRLDNLRPGQSLMPLYRKMVKNRNSKGTVYRDVYLNNGEHILEHNLVALDVYNTTIKGSNLIVHHWDHNGCNNHPDNLEVMTRSRHMQIHSIDGWANNREGHLQNHWSSTEEGRQFLRRMNGERKETWTKTDWEEFSRRVSEGIARSGGGLRGERNGMFGKIHSDETRNLISKIRSEQHIPNWCKGLTKDTDERVAALGRKASATIRANGRIAWNKGLIGCYALSDETKLKIARTLTGRTASEKTKKLISAAKTRFWEQKENEECRLCGRSMRVVTNTHLLRKHGLTIDQYNNPSNHKVVSIEFDGYEDVYNMNVEGIHNFAVSAGVVIKNCYHQDPTMMAYLRDPKSDMHGDMAVQMYRLTDDKRRAHNFKEILRQSAKNGFVFPEFYGDYYASCAVNIACNWLKMPQEGRWRDSHGIEFDGRPMGSQFRDIQINSLSDFTDHLERVERDFWGRRFRVYDQWRRDWYKRYQKTGEFEMKTGFVVAGLFSKNQVINYPVQGAAFHCLLWVLIRLVKRLRGWRSGVIAEVHDSALIDTHPDEFDDVLEMCRQLVEDLKHEWSWLIAPLSIDAKVGGVDEPWSMIKELH